MINMFSSINQVQWVCSFITILEMKTTHQVWIETREVILFLKTRISWGERRPFSHQILKKVRIWNLEKQRWRQTSQLRREHIKVLELKAPQETCTHLWFLDLQKARISTLWHLPQMYWHIEEWCYLGEQLSSYICPRYAWLRTTESSCRMADS